MGKNMETWEGERVCRMLKRRGVGWVGDVAGFRKCGVERG